MSKYHQGSFIPTNPKKYIGDVSKIFYRSGWEKKAMIRFDTDPSFLRWNSEEIIVPYISPVDDRMHRYFPDFLIEVKKRDGSVHKYLIEIKPAAQCEPPKQRKRNSSKMITEVKTWAINSAKWAAAKEFCKGKGMEFVILTEHDLGIK